MAEAPTYWLNLFSVKTWQEFQNAGSQISGFRESRWRQVKRFKEGDRLLCYLTGVSRWIGLLEVTSQPFKDSTPIWQDEVFPCRVQVKVLIALKPENAVPVHDLQGRLTIDLDRKVWSGPFRGSPTRWKQSDGEAVSEALRQAMENPVFHPIDTKKLAARPKSLETKLGPVTVPEAEETEPRVSDMPTDQGTSTDHEEVQWLLLKLGNDMGLDVWVARNDRSRSVNGRRFSDLPKLLPELKLPFNEATRKTIELIDVLWLKNGSIVAAFEIESTTSIYSGLLRMSDLIAMQPNLNIPLYVVAPDERREKVFSEISRPTFSMLKPPLSNLCRYISFSSLRKSAEQAAPFLSYINPEFLVDIAEEALID